MARTLEARVRTQLEQASGMISRADFALNSAILRNLKTVLGADIITYRSDRTIVATTLTDSANIGLVDAVLANRASGENLTSKEEFAMREIEINGRPYKIGYRTLSSRPETLIAVIADTSDLVTTQKAIASRLVFITFLIVALMVLISHWIARSVTAPILRLVEFTKSIAAGERNEKATVGSGDEISVLAAAFNEMVEQLRHSEEKLLQSEKLALAGVLAASVAHEVRNPISAIKMQAQLLRSKFKMRSDEQELMVAILREIDRVEWVVRGMLDLASPPVLQLAQASATDIVDEVLNLLGPQLRHRKIALKKAYDPSVPAIIVDRNRLKLAFINLIINASEAMTNGGLLELSVQKEDSWVAIEIQDDGAGIDPSIRDRLFSPFVTTKREGVGLGLVNTRNIVEQHRGTIELWPRDGRGTRAVIRLPLDRE